MTDEVLALLRQRAVAEIAAEFDPKTVVNQIHQAKANDACAAASCTDQGLF
jgi:hypothetical protein